MRLLYLTVYLAVLIPPLTACQSFQTGTGSPDELSRVLDFQHALNDRDAATLASDADQLRAQFIQNPEQSDIARLQLILLESQLQIRQLQQTLAAQEREIEALTTQIEALTAIEQQINRRGQQQETVNE